MQKPSRRQFMKLLGAGAVTAALPRSIQQALAVPAHHQSGTINDVKHIVILTQENRSFDHYFGTLRGVRGFADPRAVTLPSGLSVWQQPAATGTVMPFRPAVDNLGLTFLPDPPHGWNDSHAAWNNGNYDNWIANKGPTCMTYHTRQDIPYYFALADAFTICDAYYCSLMGPTDPNRYHLWSGWCGNDGNGGGPVITNAEVGYDWTTYPERLQQAGIKWKIYQDIGVGLDANGYWGWTQDPYIGNYGDNSLLYFHQYQNAQPGEPLADLAKTGTDIKQLNRDPSRLLDIFREDVRTGQLPQVSWIVAPEAFTEHPNFPANYGAWYISQFLDVLTSNPEVWSKTVFLINFDEAGGFFDHCIPPYPPQSIEQGASTVSTVNEIYPGDATHPSAPYGLGTRVPMLAVSPWSKGGWVNSQVFDHTSLIRFIEARFANEYPNLIETNITPWRRAVAGDLTSVFDFKKTNKTIVSLPSIAAYLPTDLSRQADFTVIVPTNNAMPTQENGVRLARALPYELDAYSSVDLQTGMVTIDMINTGKATAVFHVRSSNSNEMPRSYTVEPNRLMTGSWDVRVNGYDQYDLTVYGPNGFFRQFKGNLQDATHANLNVRVKYVESGNGIKILIKNIGDLKGRVILTDVYTGHVREKWLNSTESVDFDWALQRSHGWYDFTINFDSDSAYRYQLAGHLENGTDSVSDPAMGNVKIKFS